MGVKGQEATAPSLVGEGGEGLAGSPLADGLLHQACVKLLQEGRGNPRSNGTQFLGVEVCTHL